MEAKTTQTVAWVAQNRSEVARVLLIAPALTPTSPPTNVNAPPVTVPLAVESVMVARLLPTAGLTPTSPPAMLLLEFAAELPTLTFASEDELTIVPI